MTARRPADRLLDEAIPTRPSPPGIEPTKRTDPYRSLMLEERHDVRPVPANRELYRLGPTAQWAAHPELHRDPVRRMPARDRRGTPTSLPSARRHAS